MSALSLLHQLKTMGAGVWVRGERLVLRAPKNRLTADLRTDLRFHKRELLHLLAEAEASLGQRRRTPRASEHHAPKPSLSQERLFREFYQADSKTNHLFRAVHLEGPFDVAAFEASFCCLLRSQDVLRMGFTEKDQNIGVHFAPSHGFSITLLDCSEFDDGMKADFLTQHLEYMMKTPMNLAAPPLFKLLVVRESEKRHSLLLVVHHIICDEWSFGILDDTIMRAYRAFLMETSTGFVEKRGSYQDYVSYQRDKLQPEFASLQRRWWQQFLNGRNIRHWPDTKEASGRVVVEREFLSVKDTLELEHVAKRVNGSVFTVLMACLWVWHHHVFGDRDFCLGTTVSNRDFPDWERIIGHFVDQMALRYKARPGLRFSSFLAYVSQVNQDALNRRVLPFEDVQLVADAKKVPLFRSKLVFHNGRTASESFYGLDVKPMDDQLTLTVNSTIDWDLHAQVRDGRLLIEAYRRDSLRIDNGRSLTDLLDVVAYFCSKPETTLGEKWQPRIGSS